MRSNDSIFGILFKALGLVFLLFVLKYVFIGIGIVLLIAALYILAKGSLD